jgi:hypothetical protein
MKFLKAALKPVTLFIAAATMVTGCQSSLNNDNQSGDSTQQKRKPGKITKRTQDGCYLYASGAQKRDTLFVQLHVQKGKVSGQMMDMLFEKDSRKGTIIGTMNDDNTIKAVWSYMQEGVTDTMAVAFILTQKALYRKPFKTDATTGRQFTDMAASYSIELQPTDCNK